MMAFLCMLALSGGPDELLRELGELRKTMAEKKAVDRMSGAPDEEALKSFLASHDGDRPVCKHGEGFGTVSSSILIDRGDGFRLLHADGPPCRTPFVEAH